MYTSKRKYVFEIISDKWGLPEFTIMDRELYYKKFLNEKFHLSEKNIHYLYNVLCLWLDKKNKRNQNILLWYNNNSFPLFSLYIYSLLAVCSVYKLKSSDSPEKKDICSILYQTVMRALNLKESNKKSEHLYNECNKFLQNNYTVNELIYTILFYIKQNSIQEKVKEPGSYISFAVMFEVMCHLAGLQHEPVSRKHMVSVNTLLIFKNINDNKESGMSASLLLKAYPGRFGELYPVLELIKCTKFGDAFLDSIQIIIDYIKSELGIWYEHVDIQWQLIPDDRDLVLDKKILVGRSLSAAFALGILKLFIQIDPDSLLKNKEPEEKYVSEGTYGLSEPAEDKNRSAGEDEEESSLVHKGRFPFEDELRDLDLKLVAISATMDRHGRLGKVGSIWKKLLEAASIKLGFVIVAYDQSITEISKLVIIQAKTLKQAVQRLYKEMGPEKMRERIRRFLLKYAIQTKELENRCNDAFEGEDLTNIKGSVRFTDKPKVYVEDILDICFDYGSINHRHPISILLEQIEKDVPRLERDEIKELRLLFESGISGITQSNKTGSVPGIRFQKVILKDIHMTEIKKKVPPLHKIGNPYVNRAMIPHPDLFFGRKKILRWLNKRICTTSPQSVSFLGERRIGKSSFLNFLTFMEGNGDFLDDPDQYIFVFIDCQGMRSINESQFFTFIFTELKKKLKENIELHLNNDFDGLRILCDEITSRGFKLILLLDEFESITKNDCFRASFYSVLRSLANNYAFALITSSVRNLKDMCVSKEISDSPFFNIFTTRHISLFTRSEAEELIKNPSSDYGIPLAGVSDNIIEDSGLHPFFLQIMCCSWFDYLESSGLSSLEMDKTATPREVLYQFREESIQHFEFIYDTLKKNEQKILLDIIKGNSVNPDSYETELLEQKGYIFRAEDDTLHVFCSEFEKFLVHYLK